MVVLTAELGVDDDADDANDADVDDGDDDGTRVVDAVTWVDEVDAFAV